MRPLLALALVLAGCARADTAADTPPAMLSVVEVQSAALTACDEFVAGVASADRARTAAVLADDFLAVVFDGRTADADATLDALFAPGQRFTTYQTDDRSVRRLADDVALVAGTLRFSFDDAPHPPNAFTATVVRRADGWRVASWHETPILTP